MKLLRFSVRSVHLCSWCVVGRAWAAPSCPVRGGPTAKALHPWVHVLSWEASRWEPGTSTCPHPEGESGGGVCSPVESAPTPPTQSLCPELPFGKFTFNTEKRLFP